MIIIKLNITKNELYISKFYHVTKSYSTRKQIEVKSRRSDGFILILEGLCHYTFDDGMFFTAKKGDLMYLAKDAEYKMNVECEKYEYIFTDFDFCNAEKRKSAVISLKSPETSETLFRRLLHRYAAADIATATDCIALVYQIYSVFISSHFPIYLGGKAKKTVEKAKIKIAENIGDTNLSVAELAADAEISEVHFRKLFHNAEGTSPTKYITAERIKNAKQLMEFEMFTLEEIAYRCGFSSLPYFCKVFKDQTGLTPSNYKKSLNLLQYRKKN